jgi:hypothetical protein
MDSYSVRLCDNDNLTDLPNFEGAFRNTDGDDLENQQISTGIYKLSTDQEEKIITSCISEFRGRREHIIEMEVLNDGIYYQSFRVSKMSANGFTIDPITYSESDLKKFNIPFNIETTIMGTEFKLIDNRMSKRKKLFKSMRIMTGFTTHYTRI